MSQKRKTNEGVFTDLGRQAQRGLERSQSQDNTGTAAVSGAKDWVKSAVPWTASGKQRKAMGRTVQQQMAANKYIKSFVNQAMQVLNNAKNLPDVVKTGQGSNVWTNTPANTAGPFGSARTLKLSQGYSVPENLLNNQWMSQPTIVYNGDAYTLNQQGKKWINTSTGQPAPSLITDQLKKEVPKVVNFLNTKTTTESEIYDKLNIVFEHILAKDSQNNNTKFESKLGMKYNFHNGKWVSVLKENQPNTVTTISLSQYFKDHFLDPYLKGIPLQYMQSKIKSLLDSLPRLIQDPKELQDDLTDLANTAFTLYTSRGTTR
jgi:hypothetical protein